MLTWSTYQCHKSSNYYKEWQIDTNSILQCFTLRKPISNLVKIQRACLSNVPKLQYNLYEAGLVHKCEAINWITRIIWCMVLQITRYIIHSVIRLTKGQTFNQTFKNQTMNRTDLKLWQTAPVTTLTSLYQTNQGGRKIALKIIRVNYFFSNSANLHSFK